MSGRQKERDSDIFFDSTNYFRTNILDTLGTFRASDCPGWMRIRSGLSGVLVIPSLSVPSSLS